MSYKIGRNELCNCGSGLKYKKCCLNNLGNVKKFTNLESITRKAIGRDITIIHNPKNQEKMSALILDLIDEYHRHTKTLDRAQSLVCLGCMAWNLSLLSDDDARRDAIMEAARKAFSILDEQTNTDFMAIMKHLIDKKLIKYPDNKRYIVNFNVTEDNNEFSVQIASTLPN